MGFFRGDDTRNPLQRAGALVKQAAALPRLPGPVRRFYLSALREARRSGDQWTLDVVTRPHELAALLALARGRKNVVELGTASAWTTMALALAEPDRRTTTLDPESHPQRERYVALAPPDARARVDFVQAAGESPPTDAPSGVDFLFIDGDHSEEATAACFEAWRGRLAPGAIVAFHDYGDPAYPGVERAVSTLGLQDGYPSGRMFVWPHHAP